MDKQFRATYFILCNDVCCTLTGTYFIFSEFLMKSGYMNETFSWSNFNWPYDYKSNFMYT